MVSPRKFDVIKTNIFALEGSLLGQMFVLRTFFCGAIPADSSLAGTLVFSLITRSVQWLEVIYKMVTFLCFSKELEENFDETG